MFIEKPSYSRICQRFKTEQSLKSPTEMFWKSQAEFCFIFGRKIIKSEAENEIVCIPILIA